MICVLCILLFMSTQYYICVCVCVCAYVCACVSSVIWVLYYTWTHSITYICVCISVCADMHLHTRILSFARICMCRYTRNTISSVCVSVCIFSVFCEIRNTNRARDFVTFIIKIIRVHVHVQYTEYLCFLYIIHVHTCAWCKLWMYEMYYHILMTKIHS